LNSYIHILYTKKVKNNNKIFFEYIYIPES
jgi:hypothetical protein